MSQERVFGATVVLPAVNEERGVVVVLEKLRRTLDDTYEILVVDDGSTDATAIVATLHGARVISHETNRGKGAAVRTAVASASSDKIVVMDADDTYPVSAIPAIVAALDEFDIVLTVRDQGRFNISLFKRLGNQFFRILIQRLTASRVQDPLSGLYGARRSQLRGMDLRSDGFSIEAEIVVKSAKMGLHVTEHRITYSARVGESKLAAVRDGLLIGRTIVSLAAARSPATALPAGLDPALSSPVPQSVDLVTSSSAQRGMTDV